MRHRVWVGLVVCWMALAAGGTREISGEVVDAQTGAPIPRARVNITFFPPAGGEQTTILMLTDESGRFDLKNAPDSPHQVMCQRPGYLQNAQAEKVGESSSTGGSQRARWIVRLMPQVVIEGSVVDENGAPVPYATVSVYRDAVVEGHRQPQLISGNPADEAGNFRIFELKPDRYWVGVKAGPRPQLSKATYGPVFYPKSPDIQGAELMDLRPGEQRQLRVRLNDPVPAREIRGTVAGGGDAMSITLRPADAPFSAQAMNVQSQWDARTREFRLSGIAPGSYVLEAMSNEGTQMLTDSVPLMLADRDLTGVRMELEPPVSVTGVVRFVGNYKPAGMIPRLELRSVGRRFTAQTDPDGNLNVTGVLPGTYRLVLWGVDPVYLRSAWQGSRDVLHDGLVVLPHTAADPLEIELSGPGATVEGTLPDPSAPVVVALLEPAGHEMVLAKEWRGSQRFTFQGVAPGDYVLFCWPADAEVAYSEPEFLQRFGSMGKPIAIEGSETLHVELDRVVK